MTVKQLVSVYIEWAETYYRKPSGRPTRQAINLRSALRTLTPAAGTARDFTRRDLALWRDELVCRRLARRTINQRVSWVRSMFRWAACRDLVPPVVAMDLSLLPALKYGRSAAQERPKVRSVEWARVAPVVARVPRPAAMAIMFQWWTGMRASEVLTMRWDRIEPAGGHWLYRPIEHKTEHHGHPRAIVVRTEWLALLGRRRDAGWVFEHSRGDRYHVNSYAQAIRRACDQAGVEPWTSHQLRHAAGTRVALALDIEAARCLLGHQSVGMTEMYVDRHDLDVLAVADRLARRGRHSPELSTARRILLTRR